MTRSTILSTLLLAAAAACGGDDNPTPDAMVAVDIGFNKPPAALRAHDGSGADLGPADLSCLGTASTDQPTVPPTTTITATVKDFFSGNVVPNAMVTAFRNAEVGTPFDTKTADASGVVMIDVPMGTKRFGFNMKAPNFLDTLLLNQTIAPDMPTQTFGTIQVIANGTAAALSAAIGKLRQEGTGVLAGAMSDCQDRNISNFIATVSTTKGEVNHAPGADTYYFERGSPLPVRHGVRGSGSSNGLFVIIQIPPAPVAYVQVWGYPTDADLAADNLKLIAELAAPVIADTVITGSYEPLRTGN